MKGEEKGNDLYMFRFVSWRLLKPITPCPVCTKESKSYRESNEGRIVSTWLGRGLAFGRSGCCWGENQTRIEAQAESQIGCIEGSWHSGLEDYCVELAFAGLQADLAWDAVGLATLAEGAGHWESLGAAYSETLV